MQLIDRELRVIGALIEKAMTTPGYYPLTLNSLLAACNQASSRDPVVAYDEAGLMDTLAGLRDAGLVREVHRSGQRSAKYRHVLDDVLTIDPEQLSLLAVLILRGPQTVGELRSRTARYHPFADLAAVEEVLRGLATRDVPLVACLERRPGEKEARWCHLLGGDGAPAESTEPVSHAVAPNALDGEPAAPGADAGRLASLEREVASLRRELDDLRRRLDAPEDIAPG